MGLVRRVVVVRDVLGVVLRAVDNAGSDATRRATTIEASLLPAF
jgi:hypothetical protein